MINILIRTHARPKLFARCIESIKRQQYHSLHLIIGVETPEDGKYVTRIVCDLLSHTDQITYTIVPCLVRKGIPFSYNLHCNELMEMVKEGHFFFLDDDDELVDRALICLDQQIRIHPENPIVCQFIRNGKAKPSDAAIAQGIIKEGRIGLPCLVLPAHLKRMNMQASENADYLWIKQYESMTPKFIPIVLVTTDRRSKGKPENL